MLNLIILLHQGPQSQYTTTKICIHITGLKDAIYNPAIAKSSYSSDLAQEPNVVA